MRRKKGKYYLTVKVPNKTPLKYYNRLKYLKRICPDASQCIGFEIETRKIDKFFDNFTNFRLIHKAER